MLGRGGLRLGGWCGCPPLTPLFIGGREKGASPSRSHLEGGGGQGERGRGWLAPQAKGAPPLGFPPQP